MPRPKKNADELINTLGRGDAKTTKTAEGAMTLGNVTKFLVGNEHKNNPAEVKKACKEAEATLTERKTKNETELKTLTGTNPTDTDRKHALEEENKKIDEANRKLNSTMKYADNDLADKGANDKSNAAASDAKDKKKDDKKPGVSGGDSFEAALYKLIPDLDELIGKIVDNVVGKYKWLKDKWNDRKDKKANQKEGETTSTPAEPPKAPPLTSPADTAKPDTSATANAASKAANQLGPQATTPPAVQPPTADPSAPRAGN